MDDEVDKGATIEELEAKQEVSDVEFNNDPEVDKLVDQIVNEEGDDLLQVQDASIETEKEKLEKKPSIKQRIRHFFYTWWHNRIARNTTIALILLSLVGSAIVPVTRYAVLNLFGVRVSASMTFLDNNTGLPLQNIPISLQGVEKLSDENGHVQFSSLKLGNSKMIVRKLGYAFIDKNITLGWGSNPLGEIRINATGAQYVFKITDWLSDEIVSKAEASSGQDIAKSDDKGVITLTIGELSELTMVIIKADGYREEMFKVSELNENENNVKLVPSKKHVFVSNRSGKYDIYKIDIDTKNEEILLKSSGHERETPLVVTHPTKDIVAVVSSRDNEVNRDKYILSGLFVIDVVSGQKEKITRSERIDIIGWADSRLIYVAIDEGTSGGSSERSKLWSYDIESKDRLMLANSNYFNDVKLIKGKVYYSVSSYATARSKAKLFSISPNGKENQKVVDAQVWSIIQTGYSTLLFSVEDQKWYTQDGDGKVSKLDKEPSANTARIYSDSPGGDMSVWVDVRDGKGVLIQYDVKNKKETVLITRSGLTNPVYWINNQTLIFRIENNSENADYVMSVKGTKEPLKITDVTGGSRRYFY